jgi:hypothetical protein
MAWRIRRSEPPAGGRRAEAKLRSVFEEGYRARALGLPCVPPAGHRIELGFDLQGEWIAGWAKAERELAEGAGAEPQGCD